MRVFLYSAAFPFFNNVDEKAHFDLVCKYSHGHLPANLENFSPESAELIALYGSPEYFAPASVPTASLPPPLWSQPVTSRSAALETISRAREEHPNLESTQPPIYYAASGAWYALGKSTRLRGGFLLYWIRFLNVPLMGLLTWLSYFFVKRLYPKDSFLWLGVPLLVAFFPQDVHYAINNDVLSAITGAIAFYLLLDFYRSESKRYAECALTGLAVAGCFLVKFSNVAILIVLAAILALKVWRLRENGKLASGWPKVATVAAFAAAPIGAWLLRNRLVLGDWSGSAEKVAKLGWSIQPFGSMLQHPIFSVNGLASYWGEVTSRFWQGEFVWRLVPLTRRWSDELYSWSSFVFIAVAAAVLVFTWRRIGRSDRVASSMSLLLIAATALFLIGVSLAFDFDGCWYPSRDRPFLTSGRLALGMLVPFLVLYLQGLERILGWIGIARYRWIVLGVFVVVVTISEASVARPAFSSAYNWYHLR